MNELSGRESFSMAKRRYATTSQSDIADALRYISPDLPRDEWAQILMAIKHELSEAGMDLADSWSSGGQSYNEKDFRDAWRSCKPTGNGSGTVTIASLFHMANQGGYKRRNNGQTYQPPPVTTKPAIQPPDEAQKRQQSQQKAMALWQQGKPAESHPYTDSKGLKPAGLRVLGNKLLIPMYDAGGKITCVQTIEAKSAPGEKAKKFLFGCQAKDCYYPIGKPIDNTLAIVEGWGTGQSVHQATGLAVAVAFSSGNLGNIAKVLREKHPDFELVIAPDNDENRKAMEKAESAARQYNCQVVIPQFAEGFTGTDFDDLRQSVGLEEVKRQVMECRYRPVFEAVTKTEPAIDWPDYPLEALGPILAEAAQAIARTVQTPLHLAGQSVLAAAALAAQARANVQIDNRIHPLSLFLLTIGESGERKSGDDYLALKPHREWEREQHKANREETEAYKNELDTWKQDRQLALKKGGRGLDGFKAEPLPPVQPVFICEEPTLEGLQKSFRYGLPSQGLYSDEGGQFFGGHAMKPENALKSMAGLSKFWDGAPIKRTRAGHGESWAGFNRRLSCHLLTQPIVGSGVLSDPLMQQQGILARFLTASGNSLFGQRPYQKPNPQDLATIERYHAATARLLALPWKTDEDGALELDTIRPTEEAMALWVQAYNLIEIETANSGEYQSIRAAASKMAENIARMAGVMAVFSGQTEINADTMGNAITLGDYYLEQYQRHTHSGQRFMVQDQARRLLDWLKSQGHGEIHIDDISKNAPTETGVRGSVDRVRAIMQRLVDSNAANIAKINNRNFPSAWKLC